MWDWPNKNVMTHASLLGENIEKKSFKCVLCLKWTVGLGWFGLSIPTEHVTAYR